jgi:hypothetical protein
MASRRTGSGSPTRARWHGWFCRLAAVLGVLAAIDIVSTATRGIFANLVFGAGLVLWTVVTSVLTLRSNT